MPDDLREHFHAENKAGRRGETISSSYSLRKQDLVILEAVCEYLGCSKSEAIRTSLRAFAMHIGATQGSPIAPR